MRMIEKIFDEKRLNIIPIQANIKKPAVAWREYQTKLYPREKLANWDGNFAVITGKVSNGLVIVDFDDPNIYKQFFSDIETFTVKTPNGYHIYFFSKEQPKKTVKYQGYPIDIQGEGAYALCPPSSVKEKKDEVVKEYEVVKDLPILETENVLTIIEARLPKKEQKKKQDLEDFKNKIDITNIIEKYVKKEYQGKGYWQGFCPFHNDNPGGSPSLTVYKDNFYCFGCQKTGDVINFIEEIEKTDFKGAINKLEEITGIKYLWKEKEEDKIKSFLLEDRQKYASLGCGYHNDIYYFGTKVFREGKPYTAVITSDKKAYLKLENNDEIRNKLGLNYKDDFYDGGIDNIFSKDAITKWLYEDTEYITLESVYEKLVNLFKKYIYFDDERNYSLLACYRIAGFFMPIWRGRARLFIYAEMGSAKSRLSLILHNTGFNSISLGDWTLAYLQRLIESTRGETHIDDFETLDDEKKNTTTRLVKIGFMKGFKAGKISEGKTKRPETYDLFNTTTLNNTEGLDFITFDRCIRIRIPKIEKQEYDKEPKFEENIWAELRDELYILGLKYPEEINETYEDIHSDKIGGRSLFIIKPELTIAKLISEKLYEDIENFWIEEIEQKGDIDYETDWEFLAFEKIYLLNTEDFFVLKDDVIKPIGSDLYDDEEFKKKKRSMSIVIGKILSRTPIFKKREVKGKTEYKVKRENLISLLEAKRILKIIQEKHSTLSTNSTHSTLSTLSTYIDAEKEKEVERVDNVELGMGINIEKNGNEMGKWMINHYKAHKGISRDFFVNDVLNNFAESIDPEEIGRFYDILNQQDKEE